MTEAEWWTASSPQRMGEFVWNQVPDRKRRLFECACCRRVWGELTDQRCRNAVEVAERQADGAATRAELDAAGKVASEVWPGTVPTYSPGRPFHLWARQFNPKPFAAVGFNIAVDFPTVGGHPAFALPSEIIRGVLQKGEGAAQADLLRCIVGNPFRPVAFATGWRSESSVALAAAIYADRAFDRLPLLADALEEAGCDHPDVLTHLRNPGPHARGCWVVDGVLGKM